MDNAASLNYALKRRNFLVAMWLMLQQRWFVRSFNSFARVLSWLVIALGMTLITLTVVTFARNVVPVLTTPRTLPYYLLQLLVLIVSFNIYVNYFCATAFSRRIGKAPVGYVYRDPYAADPSAVPTDDSTDSGNDDGEQPIETEEDGRGDATCDVRSGSVTVSGCVHQLYKTQGSFQPWQNPETEACVEVTGVDTSAAAPLPVRASDLEHRAERHLHSTFNGVLKDSSECGSGLPPLVPTASSSNSTPAPGTVAQIAIVSPPPPLQQPKRFGGIQVVRVFGADDTVLNTHKSNSNSEVTAQMSASVPDCRLSPRTEGESGDDTYEREKESEDDRGRCPWPVLPSRCLGRCILLCRNWLRPATTKGRVPTRRHLPRSCGRHCRGVACALHRCGAVFPCTSTNTTTTAPITILHELEAVAYGAERYGPRQRAYRVLDTPRRYCSHCRRLKAPREHHCAICNECVPKMDHHCPWINNCVDVENQRYFILFISWLWLGTFIATAFLSYGVTRQYRYTTRRAMLFKQWLRSPAKEALTRELQQLQMPYGPSGVLLTSYPAILVLTLSTTMFLCMTLFIYFNRRLVLENTTVIESIYVDEKRKRVYGSTGFAYRSPYDLGWWLNFLDIFSPAGDPIVKWATQSLRSNSSKAGDVPTMSNAKQHGLIYWIQNALSRVGVTVWLIGFPTFRPTHSDGMYYTTFDALASGEQTSLLLQ